MGITGARGNKRDAGGWRSKLLQDQPQKTESMGALKGQSPRLEKHNLSNAHEIPITRNLLEIPVSFLLNLLVLWASLTGIGHSPIGCLMVPFTLGWAYVWHNFFMCALLCLPPLSLWLLAWLTLWPGRWVGMFLQMRDFFQTTWHYIPEEHTVTVQMAWLSARCHTIKEKQKNLFYL
jgi:hypothetical protein